MLCNFAQSLLFSQVVGNITLRHQQAIDATCFVIQHACTDRRPANIAQGRLKPYIPGVAPVTGSFFSYAVQKPVTVELVYRIHPANAHHFIRCHTDKITPGIVNIGTLPGSIQL